MNRLSIASVGDRLTALGADMWKIHFEARKRIAAGQDVIELTIGEPDVAVSDHLVNVAHHAIQAGRTRYSGGRGEPGLIDAIAQKYTTRTQRSITADHILCFPGTQAALAITMMALVEAGDDVLVPDPYYATYEGIIRTTGANFNPVPMSAENGFHLTISQLESAVSANTKVLLLNSPHNPTGSTLNENEIRAIGDFCKLHNLWIVSDEVYESLVYRGTFASPFDQEDLSDRTIVASSISKSHAAPGFRSGWCLAPAWITEKIQGISEAILFGNQPFIADMTEHALRFPDNTAKQMAENYQRRIQLLKSVFGGNTIVKPLLPEAGMFMLLDVSATGFDGNTIALDLLENTGVAVMPGSSFGSQANDFIRLSLTVEDFLLEEAANRIVDHLSK